MSDSKKLREKAFKAVSYQDGEFVVEPYKEVVKLSDAEQILTSKLEEKDASFKESIENIEVGNEKLMASYKKIIRQKMDEIQSLQSEIRGWEKRVETLNERVKVLEGKLNFACSQNAKGEILNNNERAEIWNLISE